MPTLDTPPRRRDQTGDTMTTMTTMFSRTRLMVAAASMLVVGFLLFHQSSSKDNQVGSDFSASQLLQVGLESGKESPQTIFSSTSQLPRISRRVVAVADLHGDLAHAHNVLAMAGLIPSPSSASATEPPSWIGGHSVLVSTGDIVDRGDDTIALYQMFDHLRSQASAAGGEVKNCLGNHEVMNALGDWRYVTKGDINTFGGAEARRKAISTDGWIGKTWEDHYNMSHYVDLLPREQVEALADLNVESSDLPPLPPSFSIPVGSFVHGGLHPAFLHHPPHALSALNVLAKSLLHKALHDQAPSSGKLLANGRPPGNVTQEEWQLWSENGPFWYRGYATESESTACPLAAEALKLLSDDVNYFDPQSSSHNLNESPSRLRSKVVSLVMGHTPHFDGFVHRCHRHPSSPSPSSSSMKSGSPGPEGNEEEPLIHLIDTGISRAYGGEQSALIFDTELFLREKTTKRTPKDEGKYEWVLKRQGRALYKGRLPKTVWSIEEVLS